MATMHLHHPQQYDDELLLQVKVAAISWMLTEVNKSPWVLSFTQNPLQSRPRPLLHYKTLYACQK